MFLETQMGGMSMAFPDVCRTPVGPVPVPIPYPNMSMGLTSIPVCLTTFVGAMPAHNIATITPMSLGDFGGVLGGMVSQMLMGPERTIVGSVKVFLQAMPAKRLLSVTGQNGMMPNMVGTTIVPSQVQVLVLG